MSSTDPYEAGLPEAIAVADGRAVPLDTEADAKMLGFLLHEGECTAEISHSEIAVWYSWLRQWRPSTYFKSLAPGVVGRVMQLGGLSQLEQEEDFQVGPGTTGTGRYVFNYAKKWVRIRREQDRMLVIVRNSRESLGQEIPQFVGEVVLCERRQRPLRTPLAKQCLHCGYDWH